MLSIIIPTLEEEKYLPLLLESVKKQGLSDYEIIIVDAGSTDRTVEIAKTHGCKIAKGRLPAKGRNQGAAIAKGDLFLFMDAETVLYQGFLKKALVEFLERKLDIASCPLEPATEHKMPKLLYNLFYNIPATLLENVFPYASSFILVKRNIHEKMGGFDESITLSDDHAYARDAAKIGKFGFLRSVKQKFIPKRYMQGGELTILSKYVLSNFYNVLIGNIRSDIFNYRFGQYKNIKERKQGGMLSGSKFLFKPHLLIGGLLLMTLGIVSWLLVFLVFGPKLIISKLS